MIEYVSLCPVKTPLKIPACSKGSLKQKVENSPKDQKFDFDLTYITSRGHWYGISWKGDVSKSGGVATNIGVHFFDMLGWIFGDVQQNTVHLSTPDKASGFLEFERARVRWFLSIDYNDLPQQVKNAGIRTYRSILMNGEEFEFSGGFTDLHTKTYENILKGEGFRLNEAKKSIEIVHHIRNTSPVPLKGDYHPLCKKALGV